MVKNEKNVVVKEWVDGAWEDRSRAQNIYEGTTAERVSAKTLLADELKNGDWWIDYDEKTTYFWSADTNDWI